MVKVTDIRGAKFVAEQFFREIHGGLYNSLILTGAVKYGDSWLVIADVIFKNGKVQRYSITILAETGDVTMYFTV